MLYSALAKKNGETIIIQERQAKDKAELVQELRRQGYQVGSI